MEAPLPPSKKSGSVAQSPKPYSKFCLDIPGNLDIIKNGDGINAVKDYQSSRSKIFWMHQNNLLTVKKGE